MLKAHAIAVTLVLFGAGVGLRAQSRSVGGPTLGYVADGTGGVRAILGIPGAAVVGERQPWGFNAAIAEMSPAQDYALAVDAEGTVRRIEFGGGRTVRAVESAMRSPERIVMSPGGRAAVVVRGTEAQVIAGTEVAAAVDLSLPGDGAVLAVSDKGVVLAAGRGGVYVQDGGDMRRVPSPGAITALAFAPDGKTAIAAGPGQVAVIEDLAGKPSWRVLAVLDDESGSPTAVAQANDRTLVVCNGQVLAIGSDGAIARYAVDATTLSRLQGNAFRLTAYGSDGPMWIIDAGAEPRLLFIPPAGEGGEVAQ